MILHGFLCKFRYMVNASFRNSLLDIRRPEYSILRKPFSATFSLSLYTVTILLITLSLTPRIRYTLYVRRAE